MPKSVGARTHSCLTALRTGKGSEVAPSKSTVLCMLLWDDSMILRSRGGQPIFSSILNRPFQLSKLNAFVMSLYAMKRAFCCSRHFSCNWQSENIIPVVDRPARKSYWDSGYTCCARVCRHAETTLAKALPTILSRDMPR